MNKVIIFTSTFLLISCAVLAIVLIIVPVDVNHDPQEIASLNLSNFEYLGNNIYKEQKENDTRVTLYIVTTLENQTVNSIETACCDFLGDKGHWKQRDMPVKVFQSTTVKNLIGYIGNYWFQQTGIDLMGVILQSNNALTDQRRHEAWNANINVVGYQRLPNNPDALAVAMLDFEDTSLRHIINYGISINPDIPNICDASHNSGCYDLQTILNHEYGHVHGLADLYASGCRTKLMFNELEAGDIRKRSLDLSTKSCVNELYEGFPLEGEEEAEPVFANSAPRLYHITNFIACLFLLF